MDTRNIDTLIGDRPVSEQLAAALSRMATKEHEHEDYVTHDEFNALKRIVDNLINLVGDESVAAQITNAIVASRKE